MRRFIFIVVVVTFAVAIFGPILRGRSAEQPPKADPKAKAQEPGVRPKNATELLMAKKLEHAQKLLGAIAINDFDGIRKNSRELYLLSKLVEFRVFKTAQYELHSNEFRRALEEMQTGAKDKNIDAATLAYLDMTMACVRCHKHVREVRFTRAN